MDFNDNPKLNQRKKMHCLKKKNPYEISKVHAYLCVLLDAFFIIVPSVQNTGIVVMRQGPGYLTISGKDHLSISVKLYYHTIYFLL